MLKLIMAVFFPALAFAVEPIHWTVGLGMESRLEREVNPDYGDLKNLPMLYAKIRFWPFAISLEAEHEASSSSSGSLQVNSESYSVGFWGRYEFLEPGFWSPYASLGLGEFMDHVQTGFAGASDNRYAQRTMAGVGVGLSKIFYKTVQAEAEVRAESVERSTQADFSGLLRVGFEL